MEHSFLYVAKSQEQQNCLKIQTAMPEIPNMLSLLSHQAVGEHNVFKLPV